MSKRSITLILSLLVLIALPLVSLYYSFQGVAFRKMAMAELQIKGSIPDSLKHLIKPAFNLYVLTGNCKDSSTLKPLIEQFKDENVGFLFIGDSAYHSQLRWNKSETLKSSGVIQMIDAANQPLGLMENCDVTLTDKKFQILHSYDLSEASNRTKIIEHIALLVTKKQ
ncbi:MAG: hypothetical protein ABIR66_12430 [Saprospiraceae bacterium]